MVREKGVKGRGKGEQDLHVSPSFQGDHFQKTLGGTAYTPASRCHVP